MLAPPDTAKSKNIAMHRLFARAGMRAVERMTCHMRDRKHFASCLQTGRSWGRSYDIFSHRCHAKLRCTALSSIAQGSRPNADAHRWPSQDARQLSRIISLASLRAKRVKVLSMGLFSRIGTWLRKSNMESDELTSRAPDEQARQADLPTPAPVPETADPMEAAEKTVSAVEMTELPSVPADEFRARFLRAVEEASESERAGLYILDATVQALVIPPAYGKRTNDELRLTSDLDEAIQRIHADNRPLSSLTWTALRDARPLFHPHFDEWAGEHSEKLHGEVGLIFFLDIEAIAVAMTQATQSMGFVSRYDPERPVVTVSDGRFETRISVHALVAESLWTGRGPMSVIRGRARALPGEFRGYQATQGGLTRRFPGVHFELNGATLLARDPDGFEHTIYYQQISNSIRKSDQGVDAWLQRATLDDLSIHDCDTALLLRSPVYLRAYPEALHEVLDGGAAAVAVRIHEGRATPVVRNPDDPGDRIDFCWEEATQRLGARRMSGHAFLVEGHGERIAVFVGDGVASCALHNALVRGILEHVMTPPKAVRVTCPSEDILMIHQDETPDELIGEARRCALRLEMDLFEDRSDRLDFSALVELDTPPAGQFELRLVPATYFDLHDEAEEAGPTAVAQSQRLQGLALEMVGSTERAAAALSRSLRHDMHDGECQLALGRVLNELGRHQQAVPFLEQAAAELADRAEVQNALGIALYLSGSQGEAADAFERAVTLDPNEASFLVNLGRCYFDEQELNKAESALERALVLEPSSAEAHASMALVCHRKGETHRAMHHAREALSEEPDNPTMRTLLETYGADPDN